MKFCKNCGNQIQETFCTNCGPEKSEVQSLQRSKKAMWVHLYPLLLTTVSFLIVQSSESSLVNNSDYETNQIGGNPFATFWLFGKILAFLPLLILWLYPAIVRMSSSSTAFERKHAGAALNFQVSLFIYISILMMIGFGGTAGNITSLSVEGVLSSLFLWIFVVGALGALGIGSLVFYILGAVAANRGKEFRYPMAIRFLK